MEIKRPESRQKMPADAHCVFKGVIFDVYQWEQELFDGTRQTFEKIKRPDTVMIIPVLPDKKILLAEQEQPGKMSFIGLLGGRVDMGEGPLAAAVRELKEESGYEAENWEIFDAVQPLPKIDWAVYTFIARDCRQVQAQELEPGERVKPIAVSFEEFIEIVFRSTFLDTEVKLKLVEARLDPHKMLEVKKTILGV